MNALEIRNITKRFGGITAIAKCSFTVAQGSITSIIGPNGAGKTTLFNIVSGFYKCDEGEVLVNNASVLHIPVHERAQCGLTRTFQSVRLFNNMSVLDNMLLGSQHINTNILSALIGHRSWRQQQDKETERAFSLLQTVNLQDKAQVHVRELSYGQRKLVEILRALMSDPSILLLDEPAAGVNRTTLQSITELIKSLHRAGKTIVIIEHDMHVVMNLSERIIVLDYGTVLAEGTPHEIQNNPKVVEAYLGARHTNLKPETQNSKQD